MVKHPRVGWLALLVVTLASGYAARYIELNFLYTVLLPESLPEVIEYKLINRHFNMLGHYTITLESSKLEDIEIVTADLLEALQRNKKWVKVVNGKVPEAFVASHGLKLKTVKGIERFAQIYQDPAFLPFLSHLNDDLESEYLGDSERLANDEVEVIKGIQGVERLTDHLQEVGHAGYVANPERLGKIVRDLTVGSPYYLSTDNKMALIFITPNMLMEDFRAIEPMDTALRQLIKTVQDKHPRVKIGRTGSIARGSDELKSLMGQTTVLTGMSLLIVFLLLSWNFRSVSTAIISVIPVILGCIWALGFFAITVKSLNILSVMVLILLIGLGVDFTIHLLSRFQQEFFAGNSLADSLEKAFTDTGVGVFNGAVTTIVAFAVLLFFDTRGIREFGFCASTGLIIFFISAFTLLPLLLTFRYQEGDQKKFKSAMANDFSGVGKLSFYASKFPFLLIIPAILAAGYGYYQSPSIPFEFNNLKLEPLVDSVLMQEQVQKRFDMSAEPSSIRTDSVAASRELAKKLRKQRVVAKVDAISTWLTTDLLPDKIQKIKTFRAKFVEQTNTAPSTIFGDRVGIVAQLKRLQANFFEIEELSFINGQTRIVAKLRQLNGGAEGNGKLKQLIDSFSDPKTTKVLDTNLTGFVQAWYPIMVQKIMKMTADLRPVTEDLLPASVLARYKSETRSEFLLHVFPRYSVYKKAALESFTKNVKKLATKITGSAQIVLMVRLQNIRDGKLVIIYCLLVVLLVLFIEFRAPFIVVVCLTPLVLGSGWTLLYFWASDMLYNHYNIVSIPLIIGIGIDDGVHYIHRFLSEGKNRLQQTAIHIAKPLCLTSFTTMVGFGSMALYKHRGVSSLGVLLFVGVGCCLVATLIVVPIMGSWFPARFFESQKK